MRMQMFVPVLPLGGSVVPAFAVVAQSLPYSADIQKLPIALPAGFSAVVAPPPTELVTPVEDALTRARYYPGPIIDTRTLVGGRCLRRRLESAQPHGQVRPPERQRWPLRWTYWAQVPAILVADSRLVWPEPGRRRGRGLVRRCLAYSCSCSLLGRRGRA